MTPEQSEQLEYEVEFGKRAEAAYASYIKDFLKVRNNELRKEFVNCKPDPQELMFLKNLQMTLVELENSINADIDTGLMAQKLLADKE